MDGGRGRGEGEIERQFKKGRSLKETIDRQGKVGKSDEVSEIN